jgi:ADP-ribose pyrophosphatase YjhB (NUDIX family)
MVRSDRSVDIQYGALPYRLSARGVEILLITSRETKRWVIPKGWPMAGKSPWQVAELEALQEAGVRGTIAAGPIGIYPYTKRFPDGDERLCFVEVYLLEVTREAAKWRERRERERAWFPREEAAAAVDEGSLARIIEDWR